MINPLIFRAYDIRGIAHLPKSEGKPDLTPETMEQIGLGFGTYIQKISGLKVVVGCDNRLSSPSLKKAFIEGLLQTGCAVTDIGMSPSPFVYFATCKYHFDGGANITASHNPKQYNGVKLVGKDAHSICGDELQEVLKIIEKGKFKKGKGRLKKGQIFPSYLAHLKSLVRVLRPLKVVVDAGNGVTGKFAPRLFKAFGCKVTELYCQPDGNFPNHEPNPEYPENVQDLIKKIKSNPADLGIAFDGDGDRLGIIDEKGTLYSADYLLLLLAEDLLSRHPGAKIIFDVKASQILPAFIRKHGGIPIMSKTGHTFIETKIKKEKALLGGEVSGHMFFAENYFGFDDAFLAALKLLSILSQSKKPLSAHFQKFPQFYTTPEAKVPCADNVKFQVLGKIKDYFTNHYPCITIDGVRVDFGDSAWGLIRCSNTTPYLTLRFEALSPKKLKEIQKIIFSELKKYPEIELSQSKN